MNNKNSINCRKCFHFYITWKPQHPYGCRAMGFKGKQMPSMVVLRSTGEACALFKKKPSLSSNPSLKR